MVHPGRGGPAGPFGLPEALPPGRLGEGGLSPKKLLERKFLTKRVQRLYTLRKLIEAVVGQLKAKGDRFLLRGKEAARSEFRLMCACHNLLKLWRAVVSGVVRQAFDSKCSPGS